MLLGEARFAMEPKKEECAATCSMFRKNPVLRQGDARGLECVAWFSMLCLCVLQLFLISVCGAFLQLLGQTLHLLLFS